MADFPDVPDAPGVPAVPRNPQDPAPAPPDLLTSDGSEVQQSTNPPQWGIFQNGQSVVQADNAVSVEFRQDWSISDYPQEGGAFQSYNKVYVPFDARVEFSSGGSLANRQALIDSVNAIAPTLDLYDVVTPEKVYESVNVTHQGLQRRADNGVGLVKIDVWLLQVSVSATATFSNTQTPGSKDAVNGGTVQAQAPTPVQQSAAPGVQ